MNRFLFRSITVNPESVLLEYVEVKADMRENGLAAQHVMHIPRAEEYVELIEALEKAAEDLLVDALEDFQILPPADPEAEFAKALAQEVGAADDDDDEPTLEFP